MAMNNPAASSGVSINFFVYSPQAAGNLPY